MLHVVEADLHPAREHSMEGRTLNHPGPVAITETGIEVGSGIPQSTLVGNLFCSAPEDDRSELGIVYMIERI
jgi:hypothetical protein